MKKWQKLVIWSLVLAAGLGLSFGQMARNDTVRNCIGDNVSRFRVFDNDVFGSYNPKLNWHSQPNFGELFGNNTGYFSYYPMGNNANSSFQYNWRDINSTFISNTATVLIRAVVKNLALNSIYTINQSWEACYITSTGKFNSGFHRLEANSTILNPGFEAKSGVVLEILPTK